jgi:2-polyprenyl-3-methyl-5-hydroxy-6-metoxy-1,4-benzoquinol methylase
VPEGKHAYWSEARHEMYQDFMRRFIAGRSGRLLDFGSGLGFFLKAMAKHENWEAFGCEISPGAVQFARETLAIKNVRCGRLENMDFQAGSFDLITMWDVLEHLPEPRLILRRCHDLLKEGGRLFIRTPNVTVALFRARLRRVFQMADPGKSYLQVKDHAHHYSVSSMRELLHQHGFSGTDFIHLRPVEDYSGRLGSLSRGVATAMFVGVKGLAAISKGHLNFDNLFVLTRKGMYGS